MASSSQSVPTARASVLASLSGAFASCVRFLRTAHGVLAEALEKQRQARRDYPFIGL